MNRYVKAGKCPYCYGQGWLPDSYGDAAPCEDCVGTGSLTQMWEHYAEQHNVRRVTPDDDGAI